MGRLRERGEVFPADRDEVGAEVFQVDPNHTSPVDDRVLRFELFSTDFAPNEFRRHAHPVGAIASRQRGIRPAFAAWDGMRRSLATFSQRGRRGSEHWQCWRRRQIDGEERRQRTSAGRTGADVRLPTGRARGERSSGLWRGATHLLYTVYAF